MESGPRSRRREAGRFFCCRTTRRTESQWKGGTNVGNILLEHVAKEIESALAHMGVDSFDVRGVIEVPPNKEMGDYAFPCFQLARILRQAPDRIARELAGKIQEAGLIQRVEAVKGYVNFFLSPAAASARVVTEILSKKDTYGKADVGRGKTVVLDYSSPNIAKPFHVGHLRSTIIGHSLARIFESLGYRTVRINHLGDWGTQFGKLIVAYRKYGSPEKLAQDPIRELLDLYVRFHQEAEADPSLEDEARAAFKALEDGGEEETRLWREFRRLSLDEFEKIYRRLGVHFDSYLGEAAYNQAMDKTVQALQEKGLLVESEGALVVELEGLPPCLIKKKDGATLYATRDLAAAIHRYETYRFDHMFYVVGAPQRLHFEQVFGVLRKMGHEWVSACEHIAFGHIRIGDEQLSTRKGNVIFLEDLLDQAVERVLAIIAERNPELEEKEAVAETVGVGAVIFNDLAHNRIKDISFDWETALNFEGDTGPYVQYTHARAASLLRRGAEEGLIDAASLIGDDLALPEDALGEPEVFQLAKSLADYPEAVLRAAEEREPSVIARYLLTLCRDFNSFYHAHRILGSPQARERLALVAAVKQVIASGLWLLGIGAPEAM